MPRQCIFCENKADSLEHLWPLWILKLVPKPNAIRIQIGNAPEKIIKKTDPEVKCVCYKCNEGWMHDLEKRVQPTIGCLVQDVALTLDAQQQTDIAAWSAKVAMVLAATVSSIRFIYPIEDRLQLRLGSSIPKRTLVWLGRFCRSTLLAKGNTLGIYSDGRGVANGCVATIIVGHLAIQILTVYPIPEYQDHSLPLTPKPGPWGGLLTQAWPILSSKTWPTPFTFQNDGGPLTIARLWDRWRMGRKVPV